MKKKMFGIVGALALALTGCVQVQVGVGTDNGFVSLAEAVPDAILEIRYYSTYNFVGERVDGYERPCALITKEAAFALKAASDDCVKRGYRLKIYDAYRPQRAVAHFMRWAKDTKDTRMKYAFYPNLDKSVLFAQGYIAEKSGHSRGSTVDLTLFDMKTGKEVDMGGARSTGSDANRIPTTRTSRRNSSPTACSFAKSCSPTASSRSLRSGGTSHS